MKLSHLLLVLVLSALVAFGVAHVAGGKGAASPKETAYERVMRTGTLRCGYVVWPHLFERDPKTGVRSGMYYDLMEEVGRKLSLKIDWAEEITLATAFDGLKLGRYDAVCMPLNPTPARARVAAFTVPVMYATIFLYARADDHRFDNNYERINAPDVKVAVLEGEMSQTIKEEDFPKAQTISMPSMADISQVMLQVSMGKADVALTEPSSAEDFLKHNPGKLARVKGVPVRLQAGGLDVAVGEQSLLNLLNTTITSLHATGFIEKIVAKHAVTPDSFYLPAQPWRVPDFAKEEHKK